jgi:hypothetical protein
MSSRLSHRVIARNRADRRHTLDRHRVVELSRELQVLSVIAFAPPSSICIVVVVVLECQLQ